MANRKIFLQHLENFFEVYTVYARRINEYFVFLFFVFSPVLAAIGLLTKRTKTYDEDDSCIAVWRNWEVYVVGIMFEATTFLPLLLDVVVDDDDDDEHWLEFPCRLYPYGDNV